ADKLAIAHRYREQRLSYVIDRSSVVFAHEACERVYGVFGLPLVGIASLPPKPPEKCADQRLGEGGVGGRVFPRQTASDAAGFLVTVTASFGHRLPPMIFVCVKRRRSSPEPQRPTSRRTNPTLDPRTNQP